MAQSWGLLEFLSLFLQEPNVSSDCGSKYALEFAVLYGEDIVLFGSKPNTCIDAVIKNFTVEYTIDSLFDFCGLPVVQFLEYTEVFVEDCLEIELRVRRDLSS